MPKSPVTKETREAALQKLRDIHTPSIDAFRETLPSAATSDLFGYLTNPDTLIDLVLPEDAFEMSANEEKGVLAVCICAIADEIDARIPPRKP